MQRLLEWRERLASRVAHFSAGLADIPAMLRERGEDVTPENIAEATYSWTHALTPEAAQLQRLDEAVLAASNRPDGLVALAQGRGNAASLPEAREQQRELLAMYDSARERVARFMAAPNDTGARWRAHSAVFFLESHVAPERSAQRCRKHPGWGQPDCDFGTIMRAAERELKESMIALCAKPPKGGRESRVEAIVELLTGMSRGDARNLRRGLK